MAIGNIGIGNIITLATLFNHLGKKCFAFSSLRVARTRKSPISKGGYR